MEMSLAIPSRAVLFLEPPVCGGGSHHGLKRNNDGVDHHGDDDEGSSESSSIGVDENSSSSFSSSSSSSKAEDDEVQSTLRKNPLESLDSLDDALPIKRGLSSFFDGKSKSFQCLSDAAASAATASDLAKKENPFNKRRRILMACKSSWRRASCTSLFNTSSLPGLHSLEENQKEEEEEEEEEQEEHKEEEENGEEKARLSAHHPLPPSGRRVKTFRSPRCFSLGDLQQHANC